MVLPKNIFHGEPGTPILFEDLNGNYIRNNYRGDYEIIRYTGGVASELAGIVGKSIGVSRAIDRLVELSSNP